MADGLRKVEEFTRLYVRAGGRIVAGPDSGPNSGPANMAGFAMHVEMEALVDASLTPMQAILSATRWPAELLRKEQELGTIAPGKVADVILVEGDPLTDPGDPERSPVIMNGTVVDTTLDAGFQNPIPRPVAEYAMDSRDPVLETLAPDTIRQGDISVQMMMTGQKFNPRSIRPLRYSDLPTTFVSESQLRAALQPSLLKTPGTLRRDGGIQVLPEASPRRCT